jgi:hypothetical protein
MGHTAAGQEHDPDSARPALGAACASAVAACDLAMIDDCAANAQRDARAAIIAARDASGVLDPAAGSKDHTSTAR